MPTNCNISFRVWIRRFIDDDTPIGDLARDMKNDHLRFPKSNKYDVIEHYLSVERHACYKARMTFEDAWEKYKIFHSMQKYPTNKPKKDYLQEFF